MRRSWLLLWAALSLSSCASRDHAVCYVFAWNMTVYCWPMQEEPAKDNYP
jgi:hypothetical protein